MSSTPYTENELVNISSVGNIESNIKIHDFYGSTFDEKYSEIFRPFQCIILCPSPTVRWLGVNRNYLERLIFSLKEMVDTPDTTHPNVVCVVCECGGNLCECRDVKLWKSLYNAAAVRNHSGILSLLSANNIFPAVTVRYHREQVVIYP